jgi:lambda family phage portal protein
MTTHWLDKVTAPIAPRWTLKRQRARIAQDILLRHYEGAASGRRTMGWRKSSGDANSVIGPALTRLRDVARDLVRNNPYAESAVSSIANDTVGWGIKAKPKNDDKRALQAWNAWAETTACDADGRHDFYGLQKLVMRNVAEAGEVLVRRRIRRPEDGLPLPMQLQVLDADFLDTTKDTAMFTGSTGRRIVQGVEFDAIGRRVAYWLFPEHPGSAMGGSIASVPVPAESVLHIFRSTRTGQVRGPSWFAPVLLLLKDLDEFADATLMKQKIAACLAVIATDVDGSATPLGTVDSASSANPQIDMLEPGAVLNLTPGRSVEIVRPPQAGDYEPYVRNLLKSAAAGLGVRYSAMTSDFTDMPFSASRAERIDHEDRVTDWRWRMLIPQFCDPVWSWAMQIAVVMNQVGAVSDAKWTPPAFPMVDPVNEGLAAQRNIRTGITSLPEEIRARGYDPDALLAEIAASNKTLDKLGIILDSDARKMTQAGQLQGDAAAPPAPAAPAVDRSIMAQFASYLRSVPDDRATEILASMFGRQEQ